MIGEVANDFNLLDQNSRNFNLYENLDKNVLLVFYPKDNTPVCSRQLTDYNFNLDLFDKHDVKIVGINIGNVSDHKSFCEKKGIKFPILSDNQKEVSKQFNALNLLGKNKRKLVLIGKDKRILFEDSVPSFIFIKSQTIFNMLENLKIISE